MYSVLVNVLDSSDTVTVNGGKFSLNLQNGMPKVYHPSNKTLEKEWNGVDIL